MGCRLPPQESSATFHDENVSLKEKLHSQVTTFFLPYLLACNDKMYMAHAVESRAPFLDVELAELLLGIATDGGRRGRAFGTVSALSNLGVIAGAIAASTAWSLVSLQAGMVTSAAFLVLAAASLLLVPDDRRRA